MPLLSPREISSMRRSMKRMLPDRGTIRRAEVIRRGGEEKKEWGDLAADVPCRIAPIGGGETGEVAARVSEETTHRITFPAGTDVTEADRVLINGTTYEVQRVVVRGAWELTRRALVREAVGEKG